MRSSLINYQLGKGDLFEFGPRLRALDDLPFELRRVPKANVAYSVPPAGLRDIPYLQVWIIGAISFVAAIHRIAVDIVGP